METIKGNAIKIMNFLMMVEDKMNKQYELREVVKKRTLTQNSYAWELIGKLADKLTMSKEEVYLEMLKSYGQSTLLPLRKDVDIRLFFKYYERHSETVDKFGVEYVYYKIYSGSSNYDTRQMKAFIDGIIQECEQQGIETLTPLEVAKMRL